MQADFKFKVEGDEKVYNVIRGKEGMHTIVWFDRGNRRESVISESQLQHKMNTRYWNIIWRAGSEIEKEMDELQYDVKNSYLITLHYFLQQMRDDDFFFDSTPSLDTLTVCLGQDDSLKGKVQRVLEEHLRDEVSYHDVVRSKA